MLTNTIFYYFFNRNYLFYIWLLRSWKMVYIIGVILLKWKMKLMKLTIVILIVTNCIFMLYIHRCLFKKEDAINTYKMILFSIYTIRVIMLFVNIITLIYMLFYIDIHSLYAKINIIICVDQYYYTCFSTPLLYYVLFYT